MARGGCREWQVHFLSRSHSWALLSAPCKVELDGHSIQRLLWPAGPSYADGQLYWLFAQGHFEVGLGSSGSCATKVSHVRREFRTESDMRCVPSSGPNDSFWTNSLPGGRLACPVSVSDFVFPAPELCRVSGLCARCERDSVRNAGETSNRESSAVTALRKGLVLTTRHFGRDAGTSQKFSFWGQQTF